MPSAEHHAAGARPPGRIHTKHPRPAGWRPRRLAATVVALGCAAGLAGCGGMLDDLFPSGEDKRPEVVAGSEGPAVGQVAPDFTLSDTLGNPVSLYATLQAAPGAVIYFNMWCDICLGHMAEMAQTVVPTYPDVPVLAVDYVMGSVAASRATQLAYGWDTPDFRFLVDPDGRWMEFYTAPMAVVVVGADHVIRLNGEYDWARVDAALAALPRPGSAP